MKWWWRKRRDGFEWREYVRTTILVRRNERRKKVEDARQAAVFGVKQAGNKGVEAGAAGMEAAGRFGKAAAVGLGKGGAAFGRGSAAAGAAFGRAAAAAARASAHGAYRGGQAIGHASAAGARRVGAAVGPHVSSASLRILTRLEPTILWLLRPRIALALTVAGVLIGAGSIYRWSTIGFDTDVAVALFLSAVMLLLVLLPRLAVGDIPKPLAWVSGGVARLAGAVRGPVAAGLALVILVAGVAGAGWWWWSSTDPATAARTAAAVPESNGDTDSGDESADAVPSIAVTRLADLEGRGRAVSGDKLRVSGKTVKLKGIEAPERLQRCPSGDSGTWACGQSAERALARLIRREKIVCSLGGTNDRGVRLATCQADGKDIAARLVRGGHVFAETGFFAAYSGQESKARSDRAGIWQGGNVERPSEYRERLWNEAAAEAPNGCPIKGEILRGSKRRYSLPWSSRYERAKIYEKRGERWFCSEQEARAAGWTRGS